MSCDNLCTAAKCEELEQRISALEQALELLEASFEAHTNQAIPIAHNYEEPEVTVSLAVEGNNLKVFVKVGDKNDDETITLPKSEPEVDVGLAVDSSSNSLKVFVKVGDKSDDETITLPKSEPKEHVKSNLKLDGSFELNILTLTVADGESQHTAIISIPLPEIPKPIEPNVNVEADIYDGILIVDVTVGQRNDFATVNLPKPDVDVSLAVVNNNLKVFVKVDDQSDSETIALPKFDPLDWLDLLKDLLFDALKTYLLNELKDAFQDLIKDAIDKLIEELIQNIFNLAKDYLDDLLKSNLSISSNFNNRDLQICVSNGISFDCTTVRIPRDGGGSGGIDEETNDFFTGYGNLNDEGILEILINSSIGNADIQVDMGLKKIQELLEEVHEYTVVDIAGNTPTAFLCNDAEADLPQPDKPQTLLTYTGKGILGLHELTKTFNDNLLTVFTEICEKNPVLAAPDWWQVRLGALRPQIVCTFRRGATRTYHSLTIPHPRITTKPTEALIPEYQKGNWQGMIVLNDNSKFIVNCISSAEAERICNIAASLISGAFLPSPFKVWITERKGEPVQSDLMKPTTIMYYPTGQKNTNPDWYFAIPKETPPSN